MRPTRGSAIPPARQQRRGHGRVTLDDVAREAGVTSITVSRFLRQPGRVAAPTAERIEAALAACGYLPNRQAGVLASGGAHTGMVAAIIPNIANSIFAETVQGLADGLAATGHELLLASTGYSVEREEAQIRAVLGWFPAALVITGRHHSPAAIGLLESAAARGTPVIEIWDRHAGGRFTQVGFDHEEVGRAMAAHLLERGYRTLAYVDSGVAEDYRAHERGAAFAAAAKAAGVPRARKVVAPPGDAFDAGRAALEALLDAKGRLAVRAAAFANDHLACGALLEAKRRGLAVPGQLALIGFGDFAVSRQLDPPLSSVRLPRREIGVAAAERLLAALQGGAAEQPPHVALDWQIVGRGST